MIKDIKDDYKALMAAKREVERLQEVISARLEGVKERKGKTFKQGSKYFQIRKRNGLNYICSSNVPFASWLKREETKQAEQC